MSKNLKKRRMLLVLPFLVLPFVTIIFWALGGGKAGKEKIAQSDSGLNMKVPDANLKEEEKLMDKLFFYDKADKDSVKMEEWMRSDPYYRNEKQQQDSVIPGLEQITQTTAGKYNQQLNVSPFDAKQNKPEEKIMQKLVLLEKEMNKTPEAERRPEQTDPFGLQVNRLEGLMQQMNTGNGEDPEMQQLNGTLDKILDIQNPQRIKERLKEKSLQNKEQVFAVSTDRAGDTIVKGFFGMNDEKERATQHAIEAVVHQTQTLVNGAVVKLRLLNDIYIEGTLIPKDNFVFGLVMLNNERLEVEIGSIRYNQALFPVKMEVYDMDGLPGIYIPGAINRDVAKQSADNSLQLMELSSADPSLKAQAATAGVGAVKTLLSKKVKLIKVTVKAGYKVLLNDKNSRQ
ncbi:MAG: conjugative transposon protein TraM [Chitinophagaceae bacterium]